MPVFGAMNSSLLPINPASIAIKEKPMKTIPLSARITQQDADFLAGLPIQGTPSEKVRYLLTEARERTEALNDYAATLRIMRHSAESVVTRIRELEKQHNQHSQLVAQVVDWLPEALSFLVSSLPQDSKGDVGELKKLEAGLADRAFRLCEMLLRWGIAPSTAVYEESSITARLPAVLEIAGVISASEPTAGKKK